MICRMSRMWEKKNSRLLRMCCGLSAGRVVRFVIVLDNASPLCSVLFLWNWVFQMICLCVKLDMFVWCRRIVLDLVFLEKKKFLVCIAPTGFVVQYQSPVKLVQFCVFDNFCFHSVGNSSNLGRILRLV